MRLAVCTLSAVLLSGCSWLGGMGIGGGQGHHAQGHHAKSSNYNYEGGRYNSRAPKGQAHYQAKQDRCQVYSPQAPIPQGCHPSQVTLGTSGGFPQQPNFGGSSHGGQYANQGYGSHAGVAHQQAAHYNPRKNKLRKPRFRGAMSLGVEKSLSGSLLDYSKVPGLDSVANYDPRDFTEGGTTSTVRDGIPIIGDTLTTTIYTGHDQYRNIVGAGERFVDESRGFESSSNPEISFDDVFSTPARVAFGGEYILNPKTTLFANAGYTQAEGNSGQVASVNATLYRQVTTRTYEEDPANPGNPQTEPSPREFVSLGFVPNQEIARFSYDFTDMKRYDLEAGARHYFNPVVKSQGFKTLTPFVGASVGASHYNDVSFNVTQEQAFFERSFNAQDTLENFYTITGPTNTVELYDSQWVPSGQLNAGMEWQVTPKTALAFETGVRIEGARKYSNGERGDKNIAIPMTIRGSYNF